MNKLKDMEQSPLVRFLSIKKSAIDTEKWIHYQQRYLAWAFMIPIELLPLPSEKPDEQD